MNRSAEATPREDRITGDIIGAAIEVHRELGPGLLESAYEQCLCHELSLRQLHFERQVSLPVAYKGVRLDCGYRMDIVVENAIVVELKTVDKLLSIHDAQLLTYLKLSGHLLGLLLNFHAPVLKDGLKRIANNYLLPSAPLRLGGRSSS
ncbi:MAG: GxxExxY protein [Pirellulales bacterium]|nr:GxxExxY protein [Pirellulales bacterium]